MRRLLPGWLTYRTAWLTAIGSAEVSSDQLRRAKSSGKSSRLAREPPFRRTFWALPTWVVGRGGTDAESLLTDTSFRKVVAASEMKRLLPLLLLGMVFSAAGCGDSNRLSRD